MSGVDPWVWITGGYAAFLVAVAYGLDWLARRIARRAGDWTHGAFIYHRDHDAWECPENQWLWPTSFDPENRVMRYRASPAVCNSCPVKSSCTTSEHGREVTRSLDPWPHSEAGLFHRGIACVPAGLAVVFPILVLIGFHTPVESALLVGFALFAAVCSIPLTTHLRRNPANFDMPDPAVPENNPGEDAMPHDRYRTRWGGFDPTPTGGSPPAGRSRVRRS
ncbi:hypothetical protein GS448_15440 [Rhodococcus hoagii]|nr:hypothetical protein [Prescottella equi]MBM4668446.1 hypothetical protein [Prescottella equi]NKV88824.1 hypothetical protein [Prescottella equi]